MKLLEAMREKVEKNADDGEIMAIATALPYNLEAELVVEFINKIRENNHIKDPKDRAQGYTEILSEMSEELKEGATMTARDYEIGVMAFDSQSTVPQLKSRLYLAAADLLKQIAAIHGVQIDSPMARGGKPDGEA